MHHISHEKSKPSDEAEAISTGNRKPRDVEYQGGHYVTFTRTSDEEWCRYSDADVSTVSTSDVLTNEAYLLSYAKRSTPAKKWP